LIFEVINLTETSSISEEQLSRFLKEQHDQNGNVGNRFKEWERADLSLQLGYHGTDGE
jgi:hypothetical protein